MEKEKLSGSMDPDIVRLIDKAEYFGPFGAIELFKDEYLQFARIDIEKRRMELPMQYINVLYSAASWSSKQRGVFSKIRAVWFLRKTAVWADKVYALARYDDLTPGQCHILMSVYVRVMQALARLHLLSKSRRADLIARIERMNAYIGNKSMDARGGYQTSVLGAWSLLCELEEQGLYELKAADGMRAKIREYVDENREKTDRDTAQLVARFARALGDIETARYVAGRAGNRDQLDKAS